MTKFIKIHFEDKQQDLLWVIINLQALKIVDSNMLKASFIDKTVDLKSVFVGEALRFKVGSRWLNLRYLTVAIAVIDWQPYADGVQ